MDPHRIGELRSQALHRAAVDLCRREPAAFDRARAVFERWSATAKLHPQDVALRTALFAGDRELLFSRLIADGECELRQTSPFSVLVPSPERWAIWKAVA